MPKPLPVYRLHKPSGRAVVTLPDASTGKRTDVYLGAFGTPESKAAYDQAIRDWLSGGRMVERSGRKASTDAAAPPPGKVTVRDVCRVYWREMRGRYADGTLRSHLYTVRAALRFLRSHFGALPAKSFGPRALRKVREAMAVKNWKRGTVNSRMRIIQQAFRYAASHELVKAEVYQALMTVPPLRRGESGVSEGEKVAPVPLPHVEAVKPHLSAPVVALIELQLLTGARGGELLIMRLCDLETSGKVWVYRPPSHKGLHRGQDRVIYLGPRAQAVVRPFLEACERMDQYLFSPRVANAERKAASARKGKPRRPNQKPNPKQTDRTIRDHYTSDTYRRAITRACDAAEVPPWHPHQLRHTAATEIRREFGLEAASLVLGHSSATVTDAVYAERDGGKVADVMLKIG